MQLYAVLATFVHEANLIRVDLIGYFEIRLDWKGIRLNSLSSNYSYYIVIMIDVVVVDRPETIYNTGCSS